MQLFELAPQPRLMKGNVAVYLRSTAVLAARRKPGARTVCSPHGSGLTLGDGFRTLHMNFSYSGAIPIHRHSKAMQEAWVLIPNVRAVASTHPASNTYEGRFSEATTCQHNSVWPRRMPNPSAQRLPLTTVTFVGSLLKALYSCIEVTGSLHNWWLWWLKVLLPIYPSVHGPGIHGVETKPATDTVKAIRARLLRRHRP